MLNYRSVAEATYIDDEKFYPIVWFIRVFGDRQPLPGPHAPRRRTTFSDITIPYPGLPVLSTQPIITPEPNPAIATPA
ncbi:MAG TPA: hypothetical protein V6D20_20325 [Candidatus Obscuribacterales bacterium]